jgi:hypothetical protein
MIETNKPMGAQWDEIGRKWTSDRQCSQNIIPRYENEACLKWRQRRSTCADLLKESDGMPLLNAHGFATSFDCAPGRCNFCGRVFDAKDERRFIRSTIIHSVAVSCQRRVVEVKCSSCGSYSQWDPSVECLHLIEGGNEGGLFLLSATKL